MKKWFLFMGILFCSLMLGVISLQAQDADLEYSFGVVVKVADDQIVLREYDYETDQEIEVTYAVNAETKVGETGTIKDVKADENVEVYYKEAEGKKIATQIEKEEAIEDETADADEDEPLDEDAEVPEFNPPVLTNEVFNETEEAIPEAAVSEVPLLNEEILPKAEQGVNEIVNEVEEVIPESKATVEVPVLNEGMPSAIEQIVNQVVQ